jgi:hypothetical protein
MVAIVYVAIELFRSPIDQGTTYLPYVAAGTIVVMTIVLAIAPAGRAATTVPNPGG